jgi:hypothetical protein
MHGHALQVDSANSLQHKQVLRALLRAVAAHEREALKIALDNESTLTFLCSQLATSIQTSSMEVADDAEDESLQHKVGPTQTTEVAPAATGSTRKMRKTGPN